MEFVLLIAVIVAGLTICSRFKWSYYKAEEESKARKWEAYYQAKAAGADVDPPVAPVVQCNCGDDEEEDEE